ncbi:MAG: ComF family protein [Cyclobacteriaceae bacterium]|nr:ComF family protein [Cyclobacteriaceae bacterium]
MPGISTILRDFVSLFYPPYCLGCSGFLVKGEEILCTSCLAELPKTHYHRRTENPVVNRLAGRLPIRHGWAFLKFQKGGIVQHLLHQLKYNHCPEIGERLGRAYGQELKGQSLAEEFDLIVPVPLHRSRLRQRGYNQSAHFAKGLSDALQIPWNESISIRTRATASQTRKSRADRWENVRQVFAVDAAMPVVGKRILLVDDVITTGATLEACGQHLLDCGCASVSVACIAEAK